MRFQHRRLLSLERNWKTGSHQFWVNTLCATIRLLREMDKNQRWEWNFAYQRWIWDCIRPCSSFYKMYIYSIVETEGALSESCMVVTAMHMVWFPWYFVMKVYLQIVIFRDVCQYILFAVLKAWQKKKNVEVFLMNPIDIEVCELSRRTGALFLLFNLK